MNKEEKKAVAAARRTAAAEKEVRRRSAAAEEDGVLELAVGPADAQEDEGDVTEESLPYGKAAAGDTLPFLRNRMPKPVDPDRPLNCLRKEKVIVRYVSRPSQVVNDPRHVLYGGMAETAKKSYTVPVLESSGVYKNVLTDNEKKFLEELLGLEYNALSVYRKSGNYWENYTVTLGKQDNVLDLSNPEDYIRYKVLLANTDRIAPDLETLRDRPKASYDFVLIEQGKEEQEGLDRVTVTQKCWKAFGRIEDDYYVMKHIVEAMDSRPVGAKTTLNQLKSRAMEHIGSDARLFLATVEDPLLRAKVLIRRAVDAGLVSRRGTYHYLRQGTEAVPMCGDNAEPTLTNAARWLTLPKQTEIMLTLQDKVNAG